MQTRVHTVERLDAGPKTATKRGRHAGLDRLKIMIQRTHLTVLELQQPLQQQSGWFRFWSRQLLSHVHVEDLTVFSQPSSSGSPFRLCTVSEVRSVCATPCMEYDMTCTDGDSQWTVCPDLNPCCCSDVSDAASFQHVLRLDFHVHCFIQENSLGVKLGLPVFLPGHMNFFYWPGDLRAPGWGESKFLACLVVFVMLPALMNRASHFLMRP